MRKLICRSLCLGLLLGTLTITIPARAFAHDPGKYTLSWLASDGGDVLRPERSGGAYHWYLGLDAGLTYSIFQNGPVSLYMPNPHNSKYPLQATDDGGNGLGFVIGGALDLPLSESIGLMGRLNYHTRSGTATTTTFPVPAVRYYPDGSTELVDATIEDKVTWTFDHLQLDLLLRIQLQKDAWYLFFGPSFSSILSNKAELDQRIVAPEDIYYVEEVNGFDDIVNNLRTASNSAEIAGIRSGRFDLKFGLGTWIPLTETLFLTPELSLAYPLLKLVEADYAHDRFGQIGDNAAIFERTEPFIENNADFNMITVFFTLGLRWRIGS